MTVVAAYWRSESDYALAADSQAELGGARMLGAVKAHRLGPVLFGCDGNASLAQRAERFLCRNAAPSSRDELEERLLALFDHLATFTGPPSDGTVRSIPMSLLSVSPWGIAHMDGAGALMWHAHGYATGSGGPEARGAMFALQRHTGPGPRVLVNEGVLAAIALDTGCGGDVVVLTSGERA